MTVLFALVPSLIALVIFVGTFRLHAPKSESQSQPLRPRPVQVRTAGNRSALRTPVPVAGARRARRPSGSVELQA